MVSKTKTTKMIEKGAGYEAGGRAGGWGREGRPRRAAAAAAAAAAKPVPVTRKEDRTTPYFNLLLLMAP